MHKTLTFLLLLSTFQLIAQADRPALQFSLNSLVFGTELSPFANQPFEGIYTFGGAAIGLLLPSDKNNYKAIELSGFFLSEGFQNYSRDNLLLGLRYEIGNYLNLTRPGSPLRFRLGAALKFSYAAQEEKPLNASVFPRFDKQYFLTISLTPHLEYWAGEKLFFDIGPVLSTFSFGLEQTRVENPAFTERQKTRSGAVLDYGGGMLRVGVGLRI